MAKHEERFDFSAKPSINRSMTIHQTEFGKKLQSNHSLDRSVSAKKFYNSFESLVSAGSLLKGKVRKLCDLFESSKSNAPPSPKPLKTVESEARSLSSLLSFGSSIRLPATEDRIVIYFTSLRGIRRTYEDCYAVRTIFRGFRVWVDERDISMDSAYKKELQSVLGMEGKRVSLPQVFIRGKYVGGVDEIKQLHETGELAKMLERFPRKAPGYVCEGCGDARFLPCLNCNGSRKVFEEEDGQLRRCPECNENGLIRCPDCCS
ncbi:Glutaredoxin [Dillenia turbinata]|uniref:Glutaredoxin n=1 Tax=Dillenia turbinata TaxID=194707 RepID=A0AAN8ZBB3_9MAGN